MDSIRIGRFLLLVLGSTVIAAFSAFFVIGLGHPGSPAIPTADSDQRMVVNGHTIRFRAHGNEGPAIVFLHGFGGSLEEWDEVISRLPKARCYSLDLLGFGGSDRPLTDYSLEGQRQQLVAFMDALGIDRAVLVGRSMGASLAVWTAAKSGERISGAVVIAPSAYPGSLKYRWPVSWVYRPGFWNWLVSVFVNNRPFGYFFPLSLARQGVGVTASYNQSFVDALAEVTQPVLLVWSAGDKRVPSTYEQAYRDRMKNTRTLLLPASVGHSASTNASNEVAAGVVELLGRIPLRK